MYGLKQDWETISEPRCFTLDDYVAGAPRWCPGCGDFSLLNSLQRLARDKQLPPEDTVVVSGIGCSSRLPHYMSTYGFHGLHGRALPVACGIRARRPELHMFVVTGDGDCCAIGTGHWLHALRYNMNMTVLLLDNNIYGLTKGQTSPTTARGVVSSTHPRGSFYVPLCPIEVALGVGNVSFVAQSVDWNPPHLYATVRAAHEHQGLSFVRILQRCPHFSREVFTPVVDDPKNLLLLEHEDGIQIEDNVRKIFTNRVAHSPHDITDARALAVLDDVVPIGLFYQDKEAVRYDEFTCAGLDMSPQEKIQAVDHELDRFMI